jgi:hypothetical protein
MKCKMEKQLYLFREGELTGEERSQLQAHLQECAACRQVWQELNTMDQALQPLRSSTTPFRANAAVLKKINEKKSSPSRWAWLKYLEHGRMRSALAFALLLMFSAMAWDRYDTYDRQTHLLQIVQPASDGRQENQFAGCRDKLQRWFAGLQKEQVHFTPLWNYTAPVRLNPQQRHELTLMLQECGLSDQHIRSIFNEYRI